MPPLSLTNLTPAEDFASTDAPRDAELRREVVFLIGLLAAVATLYVLAPGRVEPAHVALSVALIALAHAARFDLRQAWTTPVQLALVPTLFLVPPWLVPVTMGAAIVLARVPDVTRGYLPARRLLLAPGNAWFTVGPAAVMLAAGSPTPGEAGIPLLAAILAAQIGTDVVVSALWSGRLKDPDAWMVYAIDAALAPVGLLAAMAIDESPYYLALMLPLFGVLAVFAGERRARLEQLTELNHTYRGTAIALAEVVDHDDAYTGMHTRDVVELSLKVADRLGLDERRRRNVEFGALLHDVGKVVIPKEIINKPGPLDAAEWELMRTHTIAGQRMLDRIGGFMREIGAIVRASHERWDGGGYPDGLSRTAIPLEARIICACDAYDAMTTTRSYRPAMDAADAVTELLGCSGTQFDPQVVSALLEIVGVPARSVEPVAA